MSNPPKVIENYLEVDVRSTLDARDAALKPATTQCPTSFPGVALARA
jgi:hypothetical protein